ncbi:hypothetical protein BDQ17DRAFT_1326026 [Cyathus striatus]|nr:hypothetical protein BDQ17DRAFT_1326026 [Cyathus striatus]
MDYRAFVTRIDYPAPALSIDHFEAHQPQVFKRNEVDNDLDEYGPPGSWVRFCIELTGFVSGEYEDEDEGGEEHNGRYNGLASSMIRRVPFGHRDTPPYAQQHRPTLIDTPLPELVRLLEFWVGGLEHDVETRCGEGSASSDETRRGQAWRGGRLDLEKVIRNGKSSSSRLCAFEKLNLTCVLRVSRILFEPTEIRLGGCDDGEKERIKQVATSLRGYELYVSKLPPVTVILLPISCYINHHRTTSDPVPTVSIVHPSITQQRNIIFGREDEEWVKPGLEAGVHKLLDGIARRSWMGNLRLLSPLDSEPLL